MSNKRWMIWALAALLLALLLWAFLRPKAVVDVPMSPSPSPVFTPSPSPTAAPTDSPSPAPAPTAAPTPTPTPAPLRAKCFELPVEGAAGFTSISLKLRAGPSADAQVVATLSPGTPFRITGEEGDWWSVRTDGLRGYLAHKYCMINLPDIVPSIVYDATNTYSSLIASSGKALPGITGKALYSGAKWNERLGRQQFIMPVLYSMAPKMHRAQQAALKSGETLVLYEAYRPYDVQMEVVQALNNLAERDAAVRSGISSAPWSLSWFASTRLSNHQRGCAVDVSLAKVDAREEVRAGAYAYTRVSKATRYKMPTAMHELSAAAAVFSAPVDSTSRTAWRSATLSPTVNAAAKRLQAYCTGAGLTPLASEWWHFNDLDAMAANATAKSGGRYTLTKAMSAAPY